MKNPFKTTNQQKNTVHNQPVQTASLHLIQELSEADLMLISGGPIVRTGGGTGGGSPE